MKRRLRLKVWWPKLEKDVELYVKSCKSCLLVSKPSRPKTIRRELKEYCIENGIQLIHTPPQANGLVERKNSSILKRFRISQLEDKD